MSIALMESLMQQPLLQSSISVVFFSFAAVFLLFSLLVLLIRWRPWCTCDVCKTYVSSGWAGEGFTNLVDWYSHLLRRSPTHTIHVHVLGSIITANPANVEHMLKTRFYNYHKGKFFSSILGDFLGRGIFAVDGESWHFQRKMASLELGSVSVRTYAFRIVTTELRRRLLPLLTFVSSSPGQEETRPSVDLQDVFRRFSFDTICNISFDVDPSCLELGRPLSDFVLAFDRASGLSASRAHYVPSLVWKLKRFLGVGSEGELKQSVQTIDILAREVIRQKRNGGAAATGKDLLSRFLGSTEDEQFLRDIVVSFLLAGRDTVASGLTTFFFLLSKHPRVEAKILEDVALAMASGGDEDDNWEHNVGASEERTATFAQLSKMKYLQAALNESLRLFPPVQFDSRIALEDDILPDGTFVRKGTRLTYCAYAMGRMEEIWGEDCLEFRPERWFDRGGRIVSQSPFKYTVFHAGPRICPGRDLALMEMKNVVAAVVPRFKVNVLNDDHTPKFASGLTGTLAGGLTVAISARHPPP